jgi:hypothetical protein
MQCCELAFLTKASLNGVFHYTVSQTPPQPKQLTKLNETAIHNAEFHCTESYAQCNI